MSNFGFRDLRLVTPYDPSFREARSAVGASPLLAAAREFSNVAEAVADCSLVIGTTAGARRELQHPLKRLDEAAKMIRKKIAGGRVALLFGSEKRGLSNEDFSHCNWLLRIPTQDDQGSMNLGQAVAVCLYELSRAMPRTSKRRDKLDSDRRKPASSAEVERLTTVLRDALRESGYLDSDSSASAEEKVRRMARRLELSSADVATLLGMLRQVVWKMKQR